MKERPILFSGPMVRALLDGTKTQTRRAVKPQPQAVSFAWLWIKKQIRMEWGEHVNPTMMVPFCPYGLPGDRLWVREEHRVVKGGFHIKTVEYTADLTRAEIEVTERERKLFRKRKFPFAQTRARFMYRSFSRILLEIVSVRVERLREISEADAKAEGILPPRDCGDELDGYYWDYLKQSHGTCCTAIASYRTLWESLNGEHSWAANPWVWVVEFKRIT